MQNRKQFILFDLDGVIVDSYDLAYRISAQMCPGLTQKEHRDLFEGNIHEAVQAWGVRPINSNVDFNENYIPEFVRLPIFSGIKEVIQKLQEKYSLAVISSTHTNPIRELLRQHNLADSFGDIMGADVHKNKDVKIHMLLEKYGITDNNCVFVTDTLGDIQEAMRCNVRSIGVTWGFHEKERLQKGAPFAIVETPEELLATVHGFFPAYRE